jgi:molybdopterin synthase catalytic subunit
MTETNLEQTNAQESTNAPGMIRVRLLFFGGAREAVGHDELDFTLEASATVHLLRSRLLNRFPALARFGASLLAAVNEEYAIDDTLLRDADEVAFFPPVSGGSSDDAAANETRDFFELTTEPIDVGSVARRIVPNDCGATVTLDGYVREWTRGRRTKHLVYETYASMALSEMRRLGAGVREQFEITHVGIVHRTGKLEIGETSVVISVSATHRRAAFAACEWLICELKRTVPIWKKEFYEDGEVWVEGEGGSRKAEGGSGD